MKKTLSAGIILLVFLVHSLVFAPYTIDDAYITFASAKNLAQGFGPVFVPGEHVEATSSFLWACLLAPFELAGIGSVLGSKVLGLLFGLLTVIVGMRLLRALRPAATGTEITLAGVLIASCSPFIVWSMYGMEHGMVAFLLVLSMYLFHRESKEGRGWLSAIPIFLLQTARPEGFIFIALFLLARLVLAVVGRPSMKSYMVAWLLALVMPLVAYEAWGIYFFGYLLPNTVAAKVDGSTLASIKGGLLYLLRGRSAVVTYLFILSLLLALPVLFAHTRKLDAGYLRNLLRRHSGYLMVIGLVMVQVLFTILVGGDWMPNGRFMSHVAPLIIVAFIYGFSEIMEQVRGVREILPGMERVARGLTMTLVAGFLIYNVHTSERSVNGPVGDLQGSEDRGIGGTVQYLNSVATPGDAVACSDVGRVGYYFKGNVIDWWGLANEEIAHSGQALGRIKAETVLQYKPRFIVLYSTQPVLNDSTLDYGMAVFSRPFMESEEFRRNYRQVHAAEFGNRRYHVIFEQNERSQQITDQMGDLGRN